MLLIVGAGGLAPHVILAHTSVRPSIKRVLIWNRNAARAEALAREMPIEGVSISAVHDLDAALPEADVISCVTMSTSPSVKGTLLKPGAHVDLIGAYLPTMREADDETIRRAVSSSIPVSEWKEQAIYSSRSSVGTSHGPTFRRIFLNSAPAPRLAART